MVRPTLLSQPRAIASVLCLTRRRCYFLFWYYPRVPGVELCSTTPSSLLGPQPVAICSTTGRVREVNNVIVSKNTGAIFDMVRTMPIPKLKL